MRLITRPVLMALFCFGLFGTCIAQRHAAEVATVAPHQATITVPAGKAPVLDGVPTPGEWDDAGTSEVEIRLGWKVTVRFKHDHANLYFAFMNLTSPDGKMVRFPEVLLDMDNNKAASWDSDDWWFHGSFTDCQSRGAFNDYKTCRKEAVQWESTNFTTMEHAPAAIEMRIPYETIGLVSGSTHTIGIAFDATDTRQEWKLWPAPAEMAKPITWGSASPSDRW